MKEYSVFISYSRKDDVNYSRDTGIPSAIDQILKRFRKEGIKPWIDREGKYCGSAFQREIIEALDNSELVLFISSANSNNDESKFVFSEINAAFEKGMTILPLMLDDTPFNTKIGLVFPGIDRNEYYKDPQKGLNDLVENILKRLNEIRRKEKAAEEAAQAERLKIEAEKEKKRIEAEEKIRITKLESEIANIKKRITDYIEKQEACMRDLLAKEKDLNKSSKEYKDCPICNTSTFPLQADHCDICGWHFATPKELVSLEMQKTYDERLYVSKIIWNQKQQKNAEIESLKKDHEALITNIESITKEKEDYRTKYLESIENQKVQTKCKNEEISKLENRLNDTKNQLRQEQNKIKELSHKIEQSSQTIATTTNYPVAFLLVKEYDLTNVYCLYEGSNIFGSMQAKSDQRGYQMLVISDAQLNHKHFEINISREGKRFLFTTSPMNESCVLALNSHSNKIKSKTQIQINDMLFIGNVQMQLIDNFNKVI